MSDSDYLALHNQDLVDVMVEAERNTCTSAHILSDIAEGGFCYPLDEKELGPLRQKGEVFQHSVWASPILTDLMSPVVVPDADQVKDILLNDIAGGDLNFSSPSYGSRSEVALATSTTLAIRIYRYTPDWHQDGILGMSQLTIAVNPGNSTQDIELSDSYTHSTLVTGSKIWLVFRPTSNNMAVLQAYYDTLRNGAEAHALDLALYHVRDYEPGVIFIQRAGETLLLPPFWMATALSVQPTVSATFQIATATEFEERIKQLGYFRLTTRLHLMDGIQAQQGLCMFADELIEHVRDILEDSFPECNLTKVVSNICRDYETFCADLRRILEAIEDKAIARGLEDKFRAAWLNFLELKRKNKPYCCLCRLRVEAMTAPQGGSPTDRLRQHFDDFHCLRSVRTVKRIARQ